MLKLGQLLAVGRWFFPGALVSSTSEYWPFIIIHNHRPNMTLAFDEALSPNNPMLPMIVAFT